jgi:hypothetical protein
VRERTQSQLRSAIEAIDPNEKDHPERRKVSDLYASFMDEAGVEQAGLTSLREPLAKIHALRDKGDLPALFADLARLWVRIPFALDVSPDEHDATTYVVHLHQGRLGLPDRDYFLKDDAHFKGMRSAYRAHIARLFALAGEGGGEPAADNVIGLGPRSRTCNGRGSRTAIPSGPITRPMSPRCRPWSRRTICEPISPRPASAAISPPSSWRSRAFSLAFPRSSPTRRSRPSRPISSTIC